MERKLASVQRVLEIHEIPGADSIALAKVMGWNLIVKKDEFEPGDLCVFFEIDSVLPETDWSEFLRSKQFRVKTFRLNKFGVTGQGLALPLSILPYNQTDYGDGPNRPVYERHYGEGDDVTDVLGVTKYEPPDEVTDLRQSGRVLRPFIPGIPKTDEIRIQSAPWILQRLHQRPYYATLKYDGTSFTAVHLDGTFRVASRNCELEDDGNLYWAMAWKYNLPEKLALYPGLVVQGEIVGPGVQKNRMGFSEHKLFIFNVYDSVRNFYYGLWSLKAFCVAMGLEMVEVIETGVGFTMSIEQMQEAAKGNYDLSGHPREGLVIRPADSSIDPLIGQLSFKIINTDFLLKIEA
jgi:RNA ligase (TIGR02306 family)